MPIYLNKKRNKWGNKWVTIDGIKFQSGKEGKRYVELKYLEKAKVIKNLRLQVKYDLKVNDIHVCYYYADFVYEENGKEIVEDVKGFKTDVYKLKNKLMKAVHGIIIKET